MNPRAQARQILVPSFAPSFTFSRRLLLGALLLFSLEALAAVALPGSDQHNQLEAAGTLLRFIDTGLFKWTARLMAGLSIFGSAWNLKEMRFGPAVISLISAILFGTAPTWVRNIFAIGGSDSVFGAISQPVRWAQQERIKTVPAQEHHHA